MTRPVAMTPSCPACDERDDLNGRQEDDEIRVICGRCGHSWVRGASPCATCDGTDAIQRPQSMTRTPRGNQLAIIGARSIALCSVCDAAVLQESLRANQPVPEGYVAAYRHPPHHPPGCRATPPAPPPASRAAPEPRTAPSANRGHVGGTVPQRPAVSGTATHALPDPTIRQAVATVMEAREDLDATTVLLFSTHVGTTTRVSHLDNQAGTTDLASWVDTSWPDHTSVRGRMARATLGAIIHEWIGRGWLDTDIAAGLRERPD